MNKYVLERRYLKLTWLAEHPDESLCIVDSHVCNRLKATKSFWYEIRSVRAYN